MRSSLLFLMAAGFSSVLLAQATPGLSFELIIHEPNETDVGPFISTQTVLNPDYDPLQPTGEQQFLPAWGNGGGLSDELDSISDEFYALAGTTTHDLAVLRNDTGAQIDIDTASVVYGGAGFLLASSRAARDVTNAPEGASPDGTSVSLIYPFNAASISVPDGSSVAVFLIATKWRSQLDTSPRDYIWTFNFDDTGGTTYTVEGDLTIPKVGGSNPTGCATSPDGFPHGLWLLATGGLAAIVTRQKLLKAKA